MTINEQIFIIANQLANKGKKPSVALIKTRLTDSTPLPTIIKALKSWQHEPDYVAPKSAANKKDQDQQQTPASEELTAQQVQQQLEQTLEDKITPLVEEIAQLKAQIANLSQQLDKNGLS